MLEDLRLEEEQIKLVFDYLMDKIFRLKDTDRKKIPKRRGDRRRTGVERG